MIAESLIANIRIKDESCCNRENIFFGFAQFGENVQTEGGSIGSLKQRQGTKNMTGSWENIESDLGNI